MPSDDTSQADGAQPAPSAKVRYPILEPIGERTVSLTVNERFGILHNIFKHQYFATYKAIADRYGWDVANEIAGGITTEATPMLADAYRRKFNLTGAGAALVSQVVQTEFQGEGSDVAVLHEDEESAELEILCGFGSALQGEKYRGTPITDGLCGAGCRVWMQDIAQSISPDMTAEREQWMVDGAPRCRYRIWHNGSGG
ncbi:MAG TPA: hypothetical protein VHV75_04070 [Solirubrobacteraceae bacterium]|jgi:hypothetical protein|nr:hypothetical protein [Solirubrobacteraceae bacterium]